MAAVVGGGELCSGRVSWPRGRVDALRAPGREEREGRGRRARRRVVVGEDEVQEVHHHHAGGHGGGPSEQAGALATRPETLAAPGVRCSRVAWVCLHARFAWGAAHTCRARLVQALAWCVADV